MRKLLSTLSCTNERGRSEQLGKTESMITLLRLNNVRRRKKGAVLARPVGVRIPVSAENSKKNYWRFLPFELNTNIVLVDDPSHQLLITLFTYSAPESHRHVHGSASNVNRLVETRRSETSCCSQHSRKAQRFRPILTVCIGRRCLLLSHPRWTHPS